MSKLYCPRKESGVVLVVGLIFLSLMTLVGVAAIQSSTMQERMAGNAGDHSEVFQSAENALVEGEDAIIGNECGALTSLLDDLPNPSAVNGDSWSGATTVDANLQSAYIVTRIPARLVDDASEAAEETATCGGFYFVTAKAESDKGMTVVLRSTVFKRY